MNTVSALSRPAILSFALVAGVALGLAAPESKAVVTMTTNGTNACQATSGAGQAAFYSSHLFIWNGSASNQYLTCTLPNWSTAYGVNSSGTYLYWSAGAAAGGNVVCTAQSGWFAGVSNIAQGDTQNLTLAAGATGQIVFPSLSRPEYFYSINVICNVPPGFKLGLIIPFDANPPSGSAWVP